LKLGVCKQQTFKETSAHLPLFIFLGMKLVIFLLGRVGVRLGKASFLWPQVGN